MSTVAIPGPDSVAALWAAVLGVPGVGVDEDLAEYGPDSLDTARVVARVRQAYGLRVPFRTAFEAPTARALADALRGLEPAAPAPSPPAAGPGRALWPLSFDQQRLWLLDQHGGSTAYHVPVVLELRGRLDHAALREALAAVVARHGSLRTRFVLDGHEPRQEVLAAASMPPVTLPLAGVPSVDEALDRVADLGEPAFDLAAAPPWRGALYRVADEHHVLAFVIHHIVFDGWSEEVLRRELSTAYAARLAGREPELPPLALQCVDHAAWQREHAGWSGHGSHGEALDYWRRQLAGLEPLELPADRPRPAAWTGAGAGHRFTVGADVAAAVRELARAHGATPFMALLAAWTALLGRLCDVSDVVVGASTADRERPELEDLIGMFVNVLVIRAEVAGRRSFADLLAAVRETTLDAFAHREVPFERLVAELAPDRRSAHNPLFNVNFVYLNMPVADDGWPGLSVRQLRTDTRTTAFDVILAVQDQPDGTLSCYLEYSTALFDAATIERIGRYYTRLLGGVVADPQAPIGTVDILGADERRRLLVDVNGAGVEVPAECVHTVVERRAAEAPSAVAVVCGDRQLGYAELDARANRLARFLRGQGVGPETGVAIWLPRSADQIVAMLAVWKAGGYYLPLDDEHPADRIAMMLSDAAPLVLITRRAERISAGERAGVAKVVCLDRDGTDIAGLPSAPLSGVAAHADSLAAAIYTSGSTGAPKAVALTHRNVLSAQVGRVPYQEPPRSMLLPVSFAFDVFLSFAVWALSAGGRVVVPVQPRGADLDELAGLLRAQRVTHLIGPPDLQRALLTRDDVRGANHLRIGVVGGQSCTWVLADEYARSTAGARLVNEYGLTETSSGTYFITDGRTGGRDGRDGGRDGGQLPIGRPCAAFRVYLLDGYLQPVPAGVPAEIYLGGPGIARGYLDRPAITADRFVPSPYGGPGERLYRTGDLARWRRDGELEFLGRRDRQVKVRGHRIELAEVEAALLRHESVGVAAVVYLPRRQELAAYVVGAPGAAAPPDGDELRAHLRRLLPDPMVPAVFVVLDAMPLTPNGKIDRTALAELGVAEREAAAAAHTAHTAPRTPVEEAVARVWAQALERDDVDVHGDFFKLGGHSLLAATVVSRLRAELGLPLGMADLFGAPTVAGLAEVITAKARAAEAQDAAEPPHAARAQDAVAAPPVPATGAGRQASVRPAPSLDELLAGWNDTGREYELAPLPRMVADQVRRTPAAPALWADGRWATYAEFGAGAGRLAAHLRDAGVGVDGVVGVCLPRGADLVTAVHAVVAAGAAYLPLPPDLPPSRLAMMVEDARPAAVVTTAELAARVLDGVPCPRLVCLDTEAAAIAGRPAGVPSVDVPLDALAYVIFTSGSTGRPKGVAVSHRAIANRLLWMQETFPLEARDRVLFKTPFSFDVSVWELFWPLLTGAGMVVADDSGHRDLDYLADLAGSTGATTLHFVPSILALFLDEPGLAGRLRSVRRVFCSGEALAPDLVARFHTALPDVELHNLYGPTEAAVDVSWYPCTGGEDPGAASSVPIGRPVANTRLEVLDPDGRRAPVGGRGELCLGGVQLARGYLGQPALTADRFVPDPYGAPGERLYRTGDLARWREDGTVEYLGRMDHQVKIRGVRIEPAEIEAALRAHPGVAAAAVQPWRPDGGEVRLVAYVVPAGATRPATGELRDFLRDQLPAAMVPARFAALDRLPLTSSGKLDRRALPSPDADRQRDRQAAGEPAGRADRGDQADLADQGGALVWLSRDGGRTPLFCVHPGDGAAHWYQPLAGALGGPVAAFEWPRRSPASIDDAARRYLRELRATQPAGPYRLFGWCGGATVAWELARLLHDAGERVELTLLDPVVDVAQRAESASQLELFRRSEGVFTELDGAPDTPETAQRRADLVESLRLADGDPGVPLTERQVRRQLQAGRELLAAGIAYEFRPHRGRVRLLVGDDLPAERHVVLGGHGFAEYLRRWFELAEGGLELHRVGGDHYGALRPPHVAAVARHLGAAPGGTGSAASAGSVGSAAGAGSTSSTGTEEPPA